MNFLLTNDDGIRAPGLAAAVAALAELGSVRVVAPSQNYSGYGAALPPARELVYRAYGDGELGFPRGTRAYAVSAPPATCVQVGLSGALGGRLADFVVSGINEGLNAGRDIFYSGTVGGALTAHLLGLPAVAVSLDGGPGGVLHWESAAWALRAFVETAPANLPGAPLLYNLNVPNLPLARIRGVQMTTLSKAICVSRYSITVSTDHILAVNPRDDRPAEAGTPGTDTWAVQHGYVAITPLHLVPDLESLAAGPEVGRAIPLVLPALQAAA